MFCLIVPCYEILLAPVSQYVNLTQNATFTCNATGYKVSYHWTIGRGSFPSKVIDINSNALVIADVRSSDKNEYCCHYTNIECTEQRCAELIVKGMYCSTSIVIADVTTLLVFYIFHIHIQDSQK